MLSQKMPYKLGQREYIRQKGQVAYIEDKREKVAEDNLVVFYEGWNDDSWKC